MTMDSPPDELTSSLFTSQPDPSSKCQLTTAFSTLRTCFSICPYSTCPECLELEGLEAQIANIQNPPVDLLQKRYEVKGRINRRHDWLTSNLPLEVVSHIFTLFTNSDERYGPRSNSRSWNPAIRLGAVCRWWRDITLSTPQLWTNVNIDPSKHASFPEFTEKWLALSGALPLSLDFAQHELIYEWNGSIKIPPCSDVLQIIRSHASRWSELKLMVTMPMLRNLLTGLEDKLTVDTLDISMPDSFERLDTTTMKYPLAPQRFLMDTRILPRIPIQWDRLTYFKAWKIHADSLIHVLCNAQNLQQCVFHNMNINRDNGFYPLPNSPVTNMSMKELDIDIYEHADSIGFLLGYLTFPSLETLHYGKLKNEEEANALVNFIDRSQPRFKQFSLTYADSDIQRYREWYHMLPSITSLELVNLGDSTGRLQKNLERLGAHLEPTALPCLQALSIKTRNMNSGSWNGLVAIFRDDKNNTNSVVSRPLKRVTIRVTRMLWWDRDPEEIKLGKPINPGRAINLGKADYLRLRAIQESGVVLQAFDGMNSDLFDSNEQFIRDKVEQSFLESEDDHVNDD